ncbi:low molecular weight phosphotyrosine protein phosphatase, partial [Streptomyces sp. 8K308]|uniref:low molecular weight protein-tyrosine-phosphatase n=1 Tax=Streptomyces sp. 8K308 TaxID=2530388 RepID=UPI001050D8F9
MTFRICVVCSGNICRSPMAETVLRARLAEAGLDGDHTVDSAGTGGWHVGEPADPRAVAALAAAGYPAGARDHTARRFERDWFDRYDLVVAMDRGHERELRRLAPDQRAAAKVVLLLDHDPDATEPDVPDPYYGDDEGFAECLKIIERGVDGLLDAGVV